MPPPPAPPLADPRRPSTVKKRRAPVACTACHARKVRCNVTLVGRPCSNCLQDQADCVLHVSSRGKHKRRKINTAGREREHEHDTASSPALLSPPAAVTGDSTTSFAGGHSGAAKNHHLPPGHRPRPRLHQSTSPQSHQSEFVAGDEYESQSNVEGYRSIVDSTDTDQALVPLYIGELQSLRFIFHVARDKSIASKAHFLVPPPKKRPLSAEELACLESKGAFCLESEELRLELLDLFFDYIYPILPIVDPHDFFRRYDAGGAESISPLLLQSMFLTASSFISVEGLRRSGLPSLMAMKKRFYERAKALYDFDHETDKICLIQSVLLMGYWLGKSHDRTDSWHWIGVAISLSQSVGLHRDPGCSNVPPSLRSLWRRIWWCCFYRDRCIALGMGRALRINAEDCDVKKLTIEDLVSPGFSSSSSLSTRSQAIVEKCNGFAPIFLEIVSLSCILGEVFVSVYRPSKEPTAWNEVEKLDEKLKAWALRIDPRCRVDTPVPWNGEPIAMALHKHYIQTLHQVTVITLYKPFIFQGGLPPTDPESDLRAKIAWEGCVLAASAATDSFRKLSELDLVRYLPPESVTMLIPIIGILFLNKSLASGIKWHLASQNLDLVLLVVQELQEKYLAARFVLAYYTAAFEKVDPSPLGHRPVEPPASSSCSFRSGVVENSSMYSPSPAPIPRLYGSALGGGGPATTVSPFTGTEAFSMEQDQLGLWADWMPPGMEGDFEILFGLDGILRDA